MPCEPGQDVPPQSLIKIVAETRTLIEHLVADRSGLDPELPLQGSNRPPINPEVSMILRAVEQWAIREEF